MMDADEVRRLNQAGWDLRVAEGDVWTLPVSHEEIERSRLGDWSIVLTPNKLRTPRLVWRCGRQGYPLAFASGGGQQAADPGGGRRQGHGL